MRGNKLIEEKAMSRKYFSVAIMFTCLFSGLAFGESPNGNSVTHYKIPVLFTENIGQWDANARYAHINSGSAVVVGNDGFSMRFLRREGDNARAVPPSEIPKQPIGNVETHAFRFVNASTRMQLTAEKKSNAISNFYLSKDTSKWCEQVSNYETVRYGSVWKNIDVELGEEDGSLIQTFIVKPGGRVSDIALSHSCDGDEEAPESMVRLTEAIGIRGGIRFPIPASVEKGKEGHIIFSTSNRSIYDTIRLKTEFLTYLGGNGDDDARLIHIDSKGNILVCGSTNSMNFPLRNPAMPANKGNTDVFLTKFAPDGRQLVFSTYYGSGEEEFPTGIEISDNCSISICGLTRTLYLPVTGRPLMDLPPEFTMQDYPDKAFLARFSPAGDLIYSGYIGAKGVDRYTAMTRDGLNNIYISAQLYTTGGTHPLITKGVLFEQPPVGHGFPHYLLKLTPECDSVIYGTYLQPLNMDGVLRWQMKGDLEGNLVYSSYSPYKNLPLLNPIRDTFDGVVGGVVYKINTTGTKYIMFTYLDSWAAYDYETIFLEIDKENNILYGGRTIDARLPLKNPIKSGKGPIDSDIFVVKISPAGSLLFGTYTGGDHEDHMVNMFSDSCRNIVIFGATYSPNFPIVNPYDSVKLPPTDVITVISPDYKLIKSTLIHFDSLAIRPSLRENRMPMNSTYRYRQACLDASGYTYSLSRPVTTRRTFNAFQPYPKDSYEGLFTRRFLPFCGQDFISCNLSAPEIIRKFVNRNRYATSTVPVALQVVNPHASFSAKNVIAEIELPAGLTFSPPYQQTRVTLGPGLLRPGNMFQHTWTVRMDTSVAVTTCRDVVVHVSYLLEDWQSAPTPPMTNCVSRVCLSVEQVPDLEVSCGINAPDTLTPLPSGLEYAQNPFTVSATLTNFGKEPAYVGKAVLRLPSGMRIYPSPPNDSIRTVPPISPGNAGLGSWQAHAQPRPYDRRVRLQVIVADTFGVEQAQCEKELFLPAVRGLFCASFGTESVTYSPATGLFTPDSVWASLQVENVLDTIQSNILAEIDLSRARYLGLASGDSARKAPLFLMPKTHERTTWSLVFKSIPPVSVSDTIRLRYKAPTDLVWHECEWIVRVNVLSSEVACSLTSPDTLSLIGNVYQPNPFTIRSVIKNTGKTEAPLKTAELQVSLPSALSVQPPLVRALSTLSAGDSVVLTWTATALTSLYARNIDFTVTVTDTAGKTAAVCAKSLFLPPVPRGLFCDLTAPDTLKYDVASDTYSPNPFSCSVKLENVLDTLQTAVEAEIDLTGAQHLELVSGEMALKQLPDIIARGQSSVAWNVTIKSSTDKPVTETILVRYRSANEQEWKTCERTIIIQGEKRIRSAKCSVKGPDTLWADIRYEDVIPQPAQIQYTITNTGNVPLTGCSAAIILPAKYELEPGCDSVQTYGIIPPGMSTSREWFVTVNKSIALPGADDIQWTWTCDDMTTDIPCRHPITLAVGIPHGITLTPWKLRFMAKQDGPLPASQKIKLWPGNGSPVFWQAQSALPWLDWQPQSGTLATPSEISVRPTTTSMPVGVYSGALNILSTMQSTPPDVQVEYEIYRILNVERKQSPVGFTLEQNYPNPVSGDRYSVIRFTLTEKSFAVLKLIDAFGRELMTLHSGETQAGTYSIRLDSAIRDQLPSGVYYYTLLVDGKAATRTMILYR